MNRFNVVDSIVEAAHNYCKKIDWVMENKPNDRADLACLYAGIGGINECIKTLKDDGFITDKEENSLNLEMESLFSHCQNDKIQ